MKRIVVAAVVATLSVGWVTAQAPPGWIEAGRGGRLAGEMTFANSAGRLGVLFTAGSVETTGHPFFTPLGSSRRYDLVDDERGVVMSMVLFDIPADAAATPPRQGRMLLLAELFKIAGGQIQRIETVMHNLPYGARSGW